MARDLDEMEDDNVTEQDLEGSETGTCICGEPLFNNDEYCSDECAELNDETYD